MPTDQMSKIERMHQQSLAPTVCSRCGSTWFREETFQQYSKGFYSSGAGGDLSPISTMPQTVKICICGYPATPNLSGVRGGRTASNEVNSFRKSVQLAQRSIGDVKEDQLKEVIKSMALQETLDRLQQETETRLAALEKQTEEKKSRKKTAEQTGDKAGDAS